MPLPIYNPVSNNVDPAGSRVYRTWEEMPWYEKLRTYVTDIIPGAVVDTAGLGREEAWTPGNTPGRIGDRVAETVGGLLPTAGTSLMVLVAITAGLVLVLAIVKRV